MIVIEYAMKNKEKILVTINTILYRLGNKYKPDEKIYIQDDPDSLFCDEVIQDLEHEGCFSIRSSSKDIFYEDQFRNTEYEKWLESINTLKLFEYKRKLLWKYQKSIIHISTLEKIARFIGDSSNAEWIIGKLKYCEVPEYLVIYPNTKWKMVNDIFRILATSIYEDGHKLLFTIIEEFLSPLSFNSIEEWIKQQEHFSWFLNYDGYEIRKWKVSLLESGKDMYDVYYESKTGERIDVKEYDKIKDMIANTDYKKITLLKWQDGQVNLIEWERHIDTDSTKFVDIPKAFPFSDISTSIHEWKGTKYIVNEKIKLNTDNSKNKV